MAAISTYLKNKLMDHALGVASYTMPTSVKVALYKSDPTAADTGTEVTGGSYARQTMTVGTNADLTRYNNGALSFTGLPDLTATPATHVAIKDNSGNLLFFGPLAAPKYPTAGGTITIASGELVIAFS